MAEGRELYVWLTIDLTQNLSRFVVPTFSKSQKQWQLHQVHLIGNKPHTFSNFRLMAMALGENADKIEVPRSVPVRVAHELLQAGHRYLNVRTAEEFSAGHLLGAVNIPYMFKAGEGLSKWKSSLLAATDLPSAGFSGVTDIAGGYSAWRQTRLPTE
ncbi:hypothetical protein IFM89_009735 [Coptis chinensis]|uniref:Rhodanese domain-containing protein n=1 Tax=Coptis chinensis TaxID=261450 RepID=A0A835HDQ7_9MAGN|nr:hypothetical protein IFM89_009735 [Coptis chinensis]